MPRLIALAGVLAAVLALGACDDGGGGGQGGGQQQQQPSQN